jgi:hypothetical protein
MLMTNKHKSKIRITILGGFMSAWYKVENKMFDDYKEACNYAKELSKDKEQFGYSVRVYLGYEALKEYRLGKGIWAGSKGVT